MKALILACLLLTAIPAFAQKATPVPLAGQESVAPFKNASVVVVHTSDSASVAYKRMANLLLSEGYALDKTDEALRFLNTKFRPAAKLNVAQSIRAAVFPEPGGSRIELRGQGSLPGVVAGETETRFHGMKGSPAMFCWDKLVQAGSLYPAARLVYKQ